MLWTFSVKFPGGRQAVGRRYNRIWRRKKKKDIGYSPGNKALMYLWLHSIQPKNEVLSFEKPRKELGVVTLRHRPSGAPWSAYVWILGKLISWSRTAVTGDGERYRKARTRQGQSMAVRLKLDRNRKICCAIAQHIDVKENSMDRLFFHSIKI